MISETYVEQLPGPIIDEIHKIETQKYPHNRAGTSSFPISSTRAVSKPTLCLHFPPSEFMRGWLKCHTNHPFHNNSNRLDWTAQPDLRDIIHRWISQFQLHHLKRWVRNLPLDHIWNWQSKYSWSYAYHRKMRDNPPRLVTGSQCKVTFFIIIPKNNIIVLATLSTFSVLK